MLLDNKGHGKVISELQKAIQPTSKLAVLSGLFSIYGFSSLKKELSNLDEFRLMLSRWNDSSLHTLAGNTRGNTLKKQARPKTHCKRVCDLALKACSGSSYDRQNGLSTTKYVPYSK